MMKLLIIDDEKSIRNTLKEILEFEGHDVTLAADGVEGLEKATSDNYDVIFSDIKMPNMDGMELLDKLGELNVDSSVIMISGHGSIDSAVECIKKGAFDFIQKPLDLNRILITLRNATDRTNLVKETKILKKKVSRIPEIVGVSPVIGRIKEMIERVAPTDARVLITGSNGTGKELVARWLHEKSQRNTMPFIEVNCAAIPGELIESELFGHEKGAFTSAVKQHKGKFEQADGGTLFLDEIGDMSLAAQAKVLRVLQENKISRVGSDKDINVNVRVVAATNKNLSQEIEKGSFREDLYHRLSVIVIHVPPLCERKEDIPLLTKHFLDQISNENGMPPREIEPEAIEELAGYKWTGNIRELRNVVERLMILSNNVITKDDVLAYAKPVFR
ncbi:MAG: sigma-54 dependent transcriptional regulator [Bacteroidales bacterium]|nr:sigma-54 dependent transcriptional regulator [Bacteroidales bacterium]MDD3299317.1 sigma-54 dependent transcriptional regulator [Bacteroidales bacterium]MDD3843789.1 sigma-54 dependent transcriptional regulator [Bacteroidales bacterium]MDD4617549.1 sigma-54 dependent transcriptional regulator [Bacteroidales bacterium]